MQRMWVRRSLVLTLILLAGGLGGCDRGKSTPKKKKSDAKANADQVDPTAPKPEYAFAAGLAEQYPDVVTFLRRFMETSLAGDYAGYRRLVSRAADPESRVRFERVLNSLRSLSIESIEEIETAQLPTPTYLVIGQPEFRPGQKIALRRGENSKIAILVFPEEGELRMSFAPSRLQPEVEETQPATAPATSAPSYPWDQEGNY
jgi:hypothetical protein